MSEPFVEINTGTPREFLNMRLSELVILGHRVKKPPRKSINISHKQALILINPETSTPSNFGTPEVSKCDRPVVCNEELIV